MYSIIGYLRIITSHTWRSGIHIKENLSKSPGKIKGMARLGEIAEPEKKMKLDKNV